MNLKKLIFMPFIVGIIGGIYALWLSSVGLHWPTKNFLVGIFFMVLFITIIPIFDFLSSNGD